MLLMTIVPCLVAKSMNYTGQTFPFANLSIYNEILLPIFISLLVADLIVEEYRSGTLKLPLLAVVFYVVNLITFRQKDILY